MFARLAGAAMCGAVASLCLGNAAIAQVTDTTTFQVRATVVPVCSVQATNMDFGVYRATQATPTDATSTINVRCTLNTPFKLSLNGGTTTGGSIANRLLANGTSTLAYQLYIDAARSQVWGDGAQGQQSSGVGSGVSAAFTVYGRLPPLQFQPTGTYTDMITVTLEY